MKGFFVTEQTIFVIGTLILAGLLLGSSGVLISGMDLPVDEDPERLTQTVLMSEIESCKSGVQVYNECRISLIDVPLDISQSNIDQELEEYEVELIGFAENKFTNSTQVEFTIEYNAENDEIDLRVLNKCNPWESDNCTDFPCSCETRCAIDDEHAEKDIMGCEA